jgi:excisionase family DNA binding protein
MPDRLHDLVQTALGIVVEQAPEPPPQPSNELLTAAQLAERWSCSRQHIYRMMKQGLPSLRLGGSRRFRWSDAEEFIAHQIKAG